MRKLLRAVATLALALGTLAPAAAQCDEQWFPTGRLIGRAGIVNAAAAWDPDGPGPAPEVLVVGGDFYLAGGHPVSNLATWDGQSWGGFAGGFDGEVTGLAVLQGMLYASYDAGSWNRIVRWDGGSWQEVAAQSGPILGTHNGELIAERPYPDSTSAFNGASWRPLGTPCGAQVVATYNGSIAAAVVGHWNGCVSLSDGSNWIDITGGIGGFPQWGTMFAMIEGADGLYLSGPFGVSNSYGIARWDGAQWNAVGAGGFARDFHTFGDQLYATGAINGAGPVARWDGGQWHTIASQVAGGALILSTYANQLILAGKFSGVDGIPASSIARWDGAAWHPLGLGVDLSESGGSSNIVALASAGSDLYIGGSFERVGALPCGSLARFNGASWDNLQGGLASGVVEAMTVFNGEMVIGGMFTSVGGVAARNVAAWNGSSWRALGNGLGVDNNSSVRAFGTYNGELYAAGRPFDSAGNGLARWDGQTWHVLPTPVPDDVYALAEYNGELYIGCSFAVPGGGRGMARWNGSQWLPVGTPGEYIYAHALTVYNGDLIAAINSATYPGGVMAWNGQTFNELGNGFGGSRARALAVHAGELYAVGGMPGRVAVWNGAQWRQLGVGLGASEQYRDARSVTPYGSGIAVGGEFNTAGGQLSPHLAMWRRGVPECFANCDCSSTNPQINVADFTCFLQRFASGDPYANCDQSTTPPVLNVADFTCFLQRFAAGCP